MSATIPTAQAAARPQATAPLPTPTPTLSGGSDRVGLACAACLPAHEHDCSGFARAVAATLGVTLAGLADEIVDLLRHGAGWQPVADGPAAATAA